MSCTWGRAWKLSSLSVERPGRDGSESCGGILHGEVGTGSTRGVSELVLRRSTLLNGEMG